MRDSLIIGIACLAAIFLGAWLYVGGLGAPAASPGQSVRVVDEGTQSGSLTERANYRITTSEDFATLRGLVYGSGGPAAAVDFTTEEVLAVFDGSHSSGGYDIAVGSVTDAGGVRRVRIIHTVPDAGCVVSHAFTSPYQIVAVPRSPLPLSREDVTATSTCR